MHRPRFCLLVFFGLLPQNRIDMDEDEIRLHIEAIRNDPYLPSPPPSPQPPEMHTAYNMKQKVFAIQRFIESFQYNYTGQVM